MGICRLGKIVLGICRWEFVVGNLSLGICRWEFVGRQLRFVHLEDEIRNETKDEKGRENETSGEQCFQREKKENQNEIKKKLMES